MSEVISSGVTMTIPTRGETNWDALIKSSCFIPISDHDHTGGGNGVQLSGSSFQADSITGTQIRYANNTFIRWRNAANNADINVIKVDTADIVCIGAGTSDGTDNKATVLSGSESSGSVSSARGAYIVLYGNEFSGNTGTLEAIAGTLGKVKIKTEAALEIELYTNNTLAWQIGGSTQALLPSADNVRNIGSTSNKVNTIFSGQTGTGDSSNFNLFTNNTVRWIVGATSGHLNPNITNTYDIGTNTGPFRVRKIYAETLYLGAVTPFDMGSTQTYSTTGTIDRTLIAASDPLVNVANVLHTLIQDLRTLGIFT